MVGARFVTFPLVLVLAACGSEHAVTVTVGATVTTSIASTEPIEPPVYVMQGSLVVFKPDEIGFGAHGSVRQIEWESYGAATAHGSGVMSQNSCVPSCAEGDVTWVPVTFTLVATVACNGVVAYSLLEVDGYDAADLGWCLN